MREGSQRHQLMLKGYMKLSKSIDDPNSPANGIISLEISKSLEREDHRGLRLGHACDAIRP